MNGAEALIRSLLAEGVETVFGYPGGAIIPVFDKLYDFKKELRHVLVRHEQGAIHAAQGYARVSGKMWIMREKIMLRKIPRCTCNLSV